MRIRRLKELPRDPSVATENSFAQVLTGSLAWSGAAVPFAALFPWLTSIVLYRALGAAGFGTYVLLRTVADTGLLLTDLGLGSTIQRFVPELDRAGEARFLKLIAAAKALLVGVFGLVLLLVPSILDPIGLGGVPHGTLIALFALVCERNIALLGQAQLTAHLRMRTLSLISVGGGFAVACATIATAVLTKNVNDTLVAFVAAESVQSLGFMAAARLGARKRRRASSKTLDHQTVGAYIASTLVFKFARWAQGPALAAFLLGSTADKQAVALFAVMFTFTSGVLGLLLAPVSRLSTSIVASAYAHSIDRGKRAMDVLNRLTLLVSVPYTAAIAGAGATLITLTYGADADPWLLGLLAIAASAAALGGNASTALQNLEEFRFVNLASAATTVAGALFAAILIPTLGVTGATLALLATGLLGNCTLFLGLARRAEISFPADLTERLVLASLPLLAMISLQWLPPLAGVVVVVVSCGISYAIFRLCGGIGAEDRAVLSRTPHPVARLAARVV
jgi:O-antigen/teichoic acid export membrane protein